MKELFDSVSEKCSELTTKKYSTSFSIGIHLLAKPLRNPIYGIYGFVRLADEIVDSFHDFDKELLLDEFRKETFTAIDRGISLNPILNSFQRAVTEYEIDHELIDTFLKSMEMDLKFETHTSDSISTYILGSAEVVGLMCLKVFCEGDTQKYNELKDGAMKLGAAFQKINFLRDFQYDNIVLGRSYFPEVDFQNFCGVQKNKIEEDILLDFQQALCSIRRLPPGARLGVYVAYVYYYNLFVKIRHCSPQNVLQRRIRIASWEKMKLLCTSYFTHNLNMI